jgi:FkbH-like protein
MNEDELRIILADILGIAPQDVTDATSIETTKGYDSHAVMMLVLAIEEKVDYIFPDDEVATLTSWANVKAAVAAHAKGTDAPYYKALVLDADGTLWGGTLEEGGRIAADEYREAQRTYLALQERGVILCLASKNEQETLEDVLSLDSAFMPLGRQHFTVIRGGWGNKVFSLKAIAKQLNIGLDAIVFVDDSSFECEYVRAQLPMVKVVQVPPDIADYPRVAQEIAALFPTMVDTSKTAEYRALAAAEATRPQFDSEEAFLASLGIEVEIHCNRRDEIDRIAELCNKSNQFNLTTLRYTPGQIALLMAPDHAEVYSLNVKDKFGDQGLCGVLIVDHGQIEEFCLSCRILGRGIEWSPWKSLFTNGQLRYMDHLHARYVPTAKNGQVADFWSKVGLTEDDPNQDGPGCYQGTVKVNCPSWIKVTRA